MQRMANDTSLRYIFVQKFIKLSKYKHFLEFTKYSRLEHGTSVGFWELEKLYFLLELQLQNVECSLVGRDVSVLKSSFIVILHKHRTGRQTDDRLEVDFAIL